MGDVLSELAPVIRDVFVVPDAEIGRETTTLDVPGWDSIGHARLLLTIEMAFSITFAPAEAKSLKNVGELADLIDHKIAEKSRK